MNRVFLIKPASSACNLACRYCFYFDESENRLHASYGRMSKETAHTLIDRALEGRHDTALFAFQGGEPTLMGLDFYRDFTSYARSKGKNVSFALQTNGWTINDEWADFFVKENYLVGLSLDGPKVLHDLYRQDRDGKGTYTRVFNNAKLLQRKNVAFNILSTVTRAVAKKGEEVYEFFKRNGFRYLQFTSCLDPMQSERGALDYSLTPDEYANFLIRIFRLYYRDWKKGDYVSVRYYDNLINLMIEGHCEQCTMNGRCGNYYVIEADGSVFPCDFYVLDEYTLGNINTDSFELLDEKRAESGFIEASMAVHEDCRKCEFYSLCRGGCRRDREDFSTGMIGKNYLCEAYKKFFSTCQGDLETMARTELAARRRGY